MYRPTMHQIGKLSVHPLLQSRRYDFTVLHLSDERLQKADQVIYIPVAVKDMG
jgi:hypothetical protein